MASAVRRYDVLAACDVLVYINDLGPFFAACAAAAAPGGLLAFTVEAADDAAGVAVGASGRFRHGRRYCERTAGACGWALVAVEDEVLRQNAGADVRGHVFVFRRGGSGCDS